MSKAIQNNFSTNFSSYDTVFCDSLQALEWAYQNGLPESAIIKSSSPAMLWDKKTNIHNVESRWTTNEFKKFFEIDLFFDDFNIPANSIVK